MLVIINNYVICQKLGLSGKSMLCSLSESYHQTNLGLMVENKVHVFDNKKK